MGDEKRNLAETHPHLVASWDRQGNAPLRPEDVTRGSGRKVRWICVVDPSHRWRATVESRTRGSGCPYCAGRAIAAGQSLAERYPEIATQWHPTRNGRLSPLNVLPGSGKQVWWVCQMDSSHVWKTPVRYRARGHGCPYCAGVKVRAEESLAITHPEIAREWHPTLNRGRSVAAITAHSDAVVFWQCPKAFHHLYRRKVRTRVQGRGCPWCVRDRTPRNPLAVAAPELAQEWHPQFNGNSSPEQVEVDAYQAVWWQCRRDPKHVFRASPRKRLRKPACPFCARRKAQRDRSLAMTHPDLVHAWHQRRNGKLKPDQVSPKSTRVVWWKCSSHRRHVFRCAVRNFVQDPHCPICRT